MHAEPVYGHKKGAVVAGLVVVVVLGFVAARAAALEEGEGEPSFLGHPADTDMNWRVVMSEAIGYLAGWQGGSNPMDYAIRAAYLWQNGEMYTYNASGDPPMWWALPVQPDLPELVNVPAGTFQMGDPREEGYLNEKPVHDVYLDAYQIGKYEVTNQQFAEVLNWAHGQGYLKNFGGDTPYTRGVIYAYDQFITYTADIHPDTSQITYSDGIFGVRSRAGYGDVLYSMADHPMGGVSWYGAVCYCNWLSEQQGLQPCYDTMAWTRYEPVRNGYRLPTEAEWERAAAWDGTRHWNFGTTSDTIDITRANCHYFEGGYANPLGLKDSPFTSPVGWYNGVNPSRVGWPRLTMNATSPVGAYDMSGNVWEWCNDWWCRVYTNEPVINPTGPTWGSARLLRGGFMVYDNGDASRTANRGALGNPGGLNSLYGFRISRTP